MGGRGQSHVGRQDSTGTRRSAKPPHTLRAGGASPVGALDFPNQALAWDGATDKLWLSYNSAKFLEDRHGLVGQDEALKRVKEPHAPPQ